ncbi:hypothetical protein M9Y10_011881 [Tritrichomonas musculus]|uniref:USP domain-containing protein n=1 Tax=Tritrichomonas musculus TaxID=1915356 RepID=A0ABR2IBQ1_9EUKA
MDILSLEEANKVAEPISFINLLNIDASISEDVSEFACDLLNRLSKSIQCFFTITTQEEVKRSNEGIIDITTSDYINDFFIYVNSLNHKFLRDEIKSQFEEVQIKINNEVIIKKRRVHKNPLILLVSINRTFFDNGIQKKSNVPFKLFASIVHHGKSIKNGHYTSMIDCGKYWCEFNDTHVFEVKEYRAIKLTKGKDNSSGILAVYILLSEYDKTVF